MTQFRLQALSDLVHGLSLLDAVRKPGDPVNSLDAICVPMVPRYRRLEMPNILPAILDRPPTARGKLPGARGQKRHGVCLFWARGRRRAGVGTDVSRKRRSEARCGQPDVDVVS